MRFGPSIEPNRRGERGFTLIELLVAVVAGLLVAAAAVSFSKQSTRFFSQEARIAAAQMSVLAGFHRLQSDLSRAAYMSTPNMRRDLDLERVCAPEHATWPSMLQDLTGLMVTAGGSSTAPTMPDGEAPDSILIAGSMSSVETFPVRLIEDNGSGSDVYLQLNTGAMARSGFTGASAELERVFKPGRILRIIDQQRKQEYSVISSASWGTDQPMIVTQGSLPLKGEITGVSTVATAPCGIEGFGVGTQANVVDLVEYGIANVKDHPVYKETVYSDAGYALGDESRTDLIRREISLLGTPGALATDPRAEIVAEYAVDLRFGLWVSNPGTPGLVYIPPSSPDIGSRMTLNPVGTHDPGAGPTGPGSVRSVQVRLVVRSREVDRQEGTDHDLDGGFIFRYRMPDGVGFARARTLLADVALPNQGGESW